MVVPRTATSPSVAEWTLLMSFVQQLGDDLEKTKDELTRTKHFLATKDRAAKPNKPSLFSGKSGAIDAWCSHMDAYVSGSEPDEACRIACTYLDGEPVGVGCRVGGWFPLSISTCNRGGSTSCHSNTSGGHECGTHRPVRAAWATSGTGTTSRRGRHSR